MLNCRDLIPFTDWTQQVLGRIVDLEDPFKAFHYYNPSQQGSASIKKVLPALTDVSYEGMPISQGDAASSAFASLRKEGETLADYSPEATQTRNDLLAYCKQDTWAMVEILRRLRGLGGVGNRALKDAARMSLCDKPGG